MLQTDTQILLVYINKFSLIVCVSNCSGHLGIVIEVSSLAFIFSIAKG